MYSMPKSNLPEPRIYVFGFKDQLRIEFEPEITLKTPSIISLRVGFLNLPVEFVKSSNNIWIYSVKLPANFKDLDSYPHLNLRVIFWDEEGNFHTKKFKVQSPFYKHLKVEMKADTFFSDDGPFLKIKVTKPIYFEITKLSLTNSFTIDLEFKTYGNEIIASIPKDLKEENYILKLELRDINDPGNFIRLEKRMFYFAGILIPLDDINPKIVDKVKINE